MIVPSTKTLDHIIHLTPPDTVQQVSQQFRDLGFTVVPGGTHSGGLSANALVILADGIYIELISFTHPASDYPPGSPERQHRDTHPWAPKSPGWIDFSFLGSASTSIADIINARAEQEGTTIRYTTETPGGRTRASDGRVLKWVLSDAEDEGLRGVVPFFCGDVTPREWRVPIDPPSNWVHPSGVCGIAHVRLLVSSESFARISAQLTSVIGGPPVSETDTTTSRNDHVWTLEAQETAQGSGASQKPQLILSTPVNGEEEEHLATKGPSIFEVAFSIGPDDVERESNTPYGKIVWLRS